MKEGMKIFVWDTSAIIQIKIADKNGYSPSHSLYKDLSDGWIEGPYLNIFPSLAVFEVSATVARMNRNRSPILREFYLIDDNSILYDVDEELIKASYDLMAEEGFNRLKGPDLVFACIASIENAHLVTLDKEFKKYVSEKISVIDLNDSLHTPSYRRMFGI